MQWLARASPVGQDGLIGCRATERGRVLVPPGSALAFGPLFAPNARALKATKRLRQRKSKSSVLTRRSWGAASLTLPACRRKRASIAGIETGSCAAPAHVATCFRPWGNREHLPPAR